MRKTNILRNIGIVAGILVPLILNNSCEHTEYDLLDPAEAGVWTLFDTTDGLPSNEVTEIKRDSRDNLWFTFPGYGTAKYDGSDWIYFRTANSPLLTNIVNCLAEDADGKILFGTSEGISMSSSVSKSLTFTNTRIMRKMQQRQQPRQLRQGPTSNAVLIMGIL